LTLTRYLLKNKLEDFKKTFKIKRCVHKKKGARELDGPDNGIRKADKYKIST